jgi:hypothetical protein
VAVEGLTGGRQITAGADHTCVLLTNGAVTCWGLLGLFVEVGGVTTPRVVPGVSQGVLLRTADVWDCVLGNTGDVLCWDEQQTEEGSSIPPFGLQ